MRIHEVVFVLAEEVDAGFKGINLTSGFLNAVLNIRFMSKLRLSSMGVKLCDL